jgi:hypothetical protein
MLNTVLGLQMIVSLWAVYAIDRESLVGNLMAGQKWTCYLVRGEWPLVPTVISALFKCRDILTGGFLQRSEAVVIMLYLIRKQNCGNRLLDSSCLSVPLPLCQSAWSNWTDFREV